MELGTIIRDARKKANLSQEQAAEVLGVSRQTLSNWENGKTYPDILSVLKMSNLYSVSLDCLLKEETSMEQTYREFLKESTNTVRSKDRNAKLALILVTLGIWALSLIAIGLVKTGMDTVGYSLIIMWMVLPVTFFTVSAIVGRHNYFKRFTWAIVFGISLMYTLSSYATAIMAQRTVESTIFWPSFAKLPVGLAISLFGLGIGMLIRKIQAKQDCEE